MKDRSFFMAIDQYGRVERGLTHPRKDLQARGYCGRVSKMYVDQKDGSVIQIGYVIGQHWFTLYKVERQEVPV